MGYTKEWWDKNGDEIRKQRKIRYRSDPEYREKAKERARQYRADQKAKREAERSEPTLEVRGKTVPAMTTDQVCEANGISKIRIKYMQRTGYLPNALETRPVRLYTQNQSAMIGELEEFLREHQNTLRGPSTPESEAIAAKLKALVSKIENHWET